MDNKISDYKLLLKGQLIVNIPIILIMIGSFLLLTYTPFSFFKNVFISFVIGWVSWSFLVKFWILWAKKQGVSDEQLLKVGKPGFLVWNMNTIKTVTEKNKHPWI